MTADDWDEVMDEARDDQRRADAAARICPDCLGRGCPRCWDDDDEEDVSRETSEEVEDDDEAS